MVNEYSQNKQNEFIDKDEGYIDLRKILKFLIRNKVYIFSITFFITIFSFFYSLTIEKKYKGYIDIVLTDPNSGGNSKSSQILLRSLGAKMGAQNNLNTQVEILKSPSVLLPTFEFFKSEKLKSGFNLNDTRFDKWKKKQLIIKLKEKTNVLKVNVVDSEKEIINSTLEKISDTYKSYSGKEKQVGIINSLNFIKNQIKDYKKLVKDSMNEVEIYSEKYGIYIAQNSGISLSPSIIKNNLSFTNMTTQLDTIVTNTELINRKSSYENKKLNDALARIQELRIDENTNFLDFNLSELMFVNESNKNYMKKINLEIIELNNQIDFRETYFTNEDDLLKGLYRRRLKKLKALKKSVIAILNSSIKERQETLKTNFLPDKVVLKYKELIREAKRNETTLARLENDKRLLNLEFSIGSVPWKIITEPTILGYPIAPNKKVYAFGGLIIGFLCGSSIAYINEKRKNNFFDKNDLVDLFRIKETSIITYLNNESNEDIELFLESFDLNKKNENIAILYIGDIDKVKFKNLQSCLSKVITEENFEILNNFKESVNKNKRIILCEIGLTKIEDLKKLKTKFELINKKPDGIIIF